MRVRWSILLILCFSLITGVYGSVRHQAGLELTLTPVAGRGGQGGKAVYRATLKNTGTASLSLNQVNLLIQDSVLLSGDPTAFYSNFAGTLAGGAQIALKPLFTIEIDRTAPMQTYTGTVAILGGADGNALDNLVQTDFTVQVEAPDTVAPTTTIVSGPQDGETICAGTATFSYSGTDASTPTLDLQYRYRIDGGAWQGPFAESTAILTGLTDGSHRFEVSAIDLAGNIDPSPDRRTFTVSLVPPTITSIDAPQVQASSAILRWFTDRTATSTIEYGTTTSYGTTLPNSTLVVEHRLTITGLIPSTLYHYRVRSTDFCGREVVSGDQTFSTVADTIAPNTTITGVTDPDGTVCTSTAIFNWIGTDDVNTAAELFYSYKLDTDAWSVYTHDVTHTYNGLADGLHTFSVRAKDVAGNVDASPATRNVFVDTRLPEISAIVVRPRDTRALINWTTNKPATAWVEYGTTTAYGKTSNIDTRSLGAHSITLTGLTPLTLYHYRVKSNDGCRDVVSADQTFTTTAVLNPDIAVTSVSFPTPARALLEIPVSWTVMNNGPGDAPRTWTDAVYFSTKNVIDGDAILLGRFTANQALGEFGAYTLTQTLTMPLRPAGSYFILVKADVDNVLTEASTADNVLAMPIEFLKVSKLFATPDTINQTLDPTIPVEGTLRLGNLSDNALTGIQATIEGASGNITVQVTSPSRLDTFQVAQVQYRILAADETVLSNSPKIHLTSAEGEEAIVTLNLSVRPRRPQIAVQGSLTGSVVRPALAGPETQKIIECQIQNLGSVAAQNVRVQIPNLPWLTLTSPDSLGNIAPGETKKITLALRPTHDMTLGAYTGSVAVNGDNTGVTIPYNFNLVSLGVGNIRVRGEDEYTYFATDKPPLAGAHITIKNPQTNEVVVEGETQTDGLFSSDNLPEGFYNIEATAEKHGTAKQAIEIVAGETKAISVFLPRQFVTYTWTVIPVDSPDRYLITLDATFETNVPAPVLTADPPVLDLRDVAFDANRTAIVNYTLTNHGLIAIKDVKLGFESNAGYQVTPLVDNIGTLGAKSTAIIPVRIVKGGIGGQADCGFSGSASGSYPCGGNNVSQSISLTLVTGGCPSISIPYISGSGSGPGGGGSGPGGGPGGGGGSVTSSGPPGLSLPNFCDPCLQARTISVVLFIWSLIPVANCGLSAANTVAQCGASLGTGGATVINIGGCAAGAAGTVLGCFGKNTAGAVVYYPYAIISGIYSIVTACDGLPGGGSGGGGGGGHFRPTDTSADLAVLVQQRQYLTAYADAMTEYFGDRKWMNGDHRDVEGVTWFAHFQDVVADTSEDGQGISDTERTLLETVTRPSQISVADVDTMVDRWNRSLAYYARNIFTVAQVPGGENTNFIDLDRLKAKWVAAKVGIDANLQAGNTGIYEASQRATQSLYTRLLAPQSDAVCAHVKIELKQEVALTRTAFDATLEISNAPQGTRLENLRVELDIRDEANQPANVKFGYGNPVLTNLSNVSGTGVLAPGVTGKAVWHLLPTRDAAPMNATRYFVGGTLSYTQEGTTVTIPLFPAPITVKPDPLMTFHYFLQYNIYSDDPFTPEIEPTEPFTLGLIIANQGYGAARNLTIATSQPKIVDNEKGLLIDFQLIGAQVNTLPASPSLLVNMGDIAPRSTGVARWLLTSSLIGRFIDFSAKYEHIDGLGNPRVSLIDGIVTHFLEHSVHLTGVDEDNRPDFLAFSASNPDPDALPNLVFDSNDAQSAPVTSLTNPVVDAPVNINHLRAVLTLPTRPTGYVYLRFTDPSNGNFEIRKVLREDGSEVLLDRDGWGNVWTTDRSIRGPGQSPTREHRLHIFDKNPSPTYTLVFGQKAPVLTTAGGAKQYVDGVQATFPGVVTAKIGDSNYIEAPDRSSGIRLTPGRLNEGQVVNLLGTLHTDTNGERYLEPNTVTPNGTGNLEPLGLSPRTLYSGDFFYDASTGAGQRGMKDGFGLNMLGLLVRTVGKVSATTADGFKIADGYGRTVRVIVPAGVTLPVVGSYVGVTGVVSSEQITGNLYPVLQIRRNTDLFYDPASTLAAEFISPVGALVTGENLFALYGIPFNPNPTSVLQNFDPGNGSGLNGRLNRYDPITQSEVIYSAANPSLFGDLMMGEGYRINLTAAETKEIRYSGFRTDFADWLLGIRKEGATRIGSPLPYAFDFSELKVSDGIKTVSVRDAIHTQFPPWLNNVQFYDPTTQTLRNLGLVEDNPAAVLMKPWTGYWVTAGGKNVGIIFPTPLQPVAPVLKTIDPQSIGAGGSAFTVTLTGTNFLPQSVVRWNNAARPTTYVSSTKLTVSIPASDIASAGSAAVTIFNPVGTGSVSNAKIIVIGIPQIAVTGVRSITRANGQITAVVEITNIGTGAATNVRFLTAKLGTTNAVGLPANLSSLAAGAVTTIEVVFPGTAGTAGAIAILKIGGTITGGNFTASRRVTLP